MSKETVASRRRLRWIAVPLLFLSFVLGLTVYAFVIRERAQSILRDVYALRVGVSTVEEVERLAAGHASALRERHCGGPKCFVTFEIYNTWLYRLKLEPIARFFVAVEAKNGTVNYVEVTLERDTRVFPTSSSAGMTTEYQQVPERMLRFSRGPYWFPTPVGKPYLYVALTSQASAVQREHAYAYSFKCLIKPGGGCDLPCDYLPLAWRDWQAELEDQGFGARGFGPYYPDRERCK